MTEKGTEIFTPHELKTVEIDIEKKIFRINGEDFGKNCLGFSIGCEPGKDDFFNVSMRVDSVIHFAYYDADGSQRKSGSVKTEV